MQSEVPGHARTSAMRVVAYLNASIETMLEWDDSETLFFWCLIKVKKKLVDFENPSQCFSAIKTGYIQFDRGCGKGKRKCSFGGEVLLKTKENNFWVFSDAFSFPQFSTYTPDGHYYFFFWSWDGHYYLNKSITNLQHLSNENKTIRQGKINEF